MGTETRADIIREMRETADANERLGFHDLRDLSTDSLRAWADRIEAAANRERVEREFAHKKVEEALSDEIAIRDEKIRRSVPGNAAAMRCWLKTIRNMSEHNENDLGNPVVRGLLDQLTRIHTCAREALSAPARNCDRFGKRDAVEAFIRDTADGTLDPDAASAEDVDEYMREHWFLFKIWLFATAEGGAS